MAWLLAMDAGEAHLEGQTHPPLKAVLGVRQPEQAGSAGEGVS